MGKLTGGWPDKSQCEGFTGFGSLIRVLHNDEDKCELYMGLTLRGHLLIRAASRWPSKILVAGASLHLRLHINDFTPRRMAA